jgi:hypothetical protein
MRGKSARMKKGGNCNLKFQCLVILIIFIGIFCTWKVINFFIPCCTNRHSNDHILTKVAMIDSKKFLSSQKPTSPPIIYQDNTRMSYYDIITSPTRAKLQHHSLHSLKELERMSLEDVMVHVNQKRSMPNSK